MNKTVLSIITMMLMAIQGLSAQVLNATRAGSADTTYAANSILATGTWAKIRVSTTGIHQLTNDVIRKAGFSDLSKVKIYGYGGNLIPDYLNQSYLKEHDDLKEVATYTANGVKYFYANGPVSWEYESTIKRTRNYFSDYGYYFITENSNTGLTCTEQDLYDKVTSSTFAHHAFYENDKYAWAQTGRNLVDDVKVTAGNPKTYNITIPKGNTTATVYVALTSSGAGRYYITCGSQQAKDTLKAMEKYDVCFSGTKTFYSVDLSSFQTDENGAIICPVTISTSTSNHTVRLDYISASFSTAATPATLSSGTYPVAEYSCNITNQNHHADSPADMIIVIPTNQNLLTQAQALANFHLSHDKLTSLIVPADELYNEFSSGTPDFSAYRRYLKMFYDRSQTLGTKMPKCVLLFGSSLWDNRMITMSSYDPDSYLLCHETENSYNTLPSFTSDDYITVLHDNKTIHETSSNIDPQLTMDIGIGRIPVTNTTDAKNVVNKIKNYYSIIGPWQNNMLFFADNGDDNSHMNNINIVADSVISEYPGYYVKKALSDAYIMKTTSTGERFPDLANLIQKQQKKGVLVMNYGGHSSWTQLADEMLVTLADVKAYKGENYPLWFVAGCETVPFDQTVETLGEELLLNKNGGAVAFYGTSRTVEESKNAIMNKSFMRYVLSYDADGNPLTLGEAQRLAKNAMITNVNKDGKDLSYNKHQFHLIGDPAMTLAIPRYNVVVDAINNVAVTNAVDTVKGYSTVTIKGHVEDLKASPVTNFNGTAEVLVRDSKREFYCRGNKGEETLQKYKDRQNVLYNGTCDVTAGQFTCTFRVPGDIYNDGGTGLINVFAYDLTQMLSAHGACGNFSVQGWQDADNDSIGPAVFAYLNKSTFQNGDDVSQTPFFVAEISDNDGLCTTGMALGHNMELVIDGSASKTYDLNDNFSYDSGSYTSGQTFYTIPTLTSGAHSLTFTAWDILGNPSRTSLTFNVKKGLQPELTHVFVSPNPITDEATFYVTHDMKGSEARISVDIIDLYGRVVQTLEWSDTFSETNSTTKYKWTPEGLSRGMYLYKVRVSCNGSEDSTMSQKLILAQ